MASHTRILYGRVSLGKQFYKQTSVVRVSSLQLELGVQQREQMGNAALQSQLLRLDLPFLLSRSHTALHLLNIRENSPVIRPHYSATYTKLFITKRLHQVKEKQEFLVEFITVLTPGLQ